MKFPICLKNFARILSKVPIYSHFRPSDPLWVFLGIPLVCVSLFPSLLYALPSNGTVQAGKAAISQPSQEKLVIQQTTEKAIIDWQRFGIKSNEHVDFQLPTNNGVTLNRVTGGERSDIFGRLSSNGNLMLINPNGIVFGAGSQVDVNGLVATTLDIDNQDFMSGRYLFNGDTSGFVSNAGEITVAEGGLLAFVAPGVENSGVISAQLGRVVLSSGTLFTVDFYGDNLVTLGVDGKVLDQVIGPDGTPLTSLVSNSGTITANGGQVIMHVNAAKNIVDNVINMDGLVEATSARVENGEIILDGGDGNVNVAGTLNASGDDAGETGGRITVKAASVTVDEGKILATGNQAKGGDIIVEGESWVGLGGDVDASGRMGGAVRVEAGGFSLASAIKAKGTTDKGGSVTLTTINQSLGKHLRLHRCVGRRRRHDHEHSGTTNHHLRQL